MQDLNDYQKRIAQLVVERGFDKETPLEVFTLLVEEVGEIAKALRVWNGQKTGTDSKLRDLEEELADVFWLVLDLSNRLNINLADAFEAKEAKNASREWK